MSGLWILSPVLTALGTGAILVIWSFVKQRTPAGERDTEKRLLMYVLYIGGLLVSASLAMCVAWSGDISVILFELMEDIPIYFQIDPVGRWFVTLVTVVWVLAGIYSIVYMRREGGEKRFFGLYLLVYGVLVCLDFAGNLVTMYLFYELVTIVSFPLVMHNGSREAIMAALKYLFYSLCGAYMGLFGIYFLYRHCGSAAFVPGGILSSQLTGAQGGILLVAIFLMLMGFGAKAGMFPLHAWLPAAHPVAPSPASAVLSGVIVKSGVLAIIRVVYYVVGPDYLRGTWVQYAWMALTLSTVFMGSLLAYREPVLKKRLAYSTVSQVSYILFGLAILSPTAFTGALLHVAFHGVVKSGLFLTAGIFLSCCGKTRVDELSGIGRRMPVTLWGYTLLALSLIGIPPACGFVSKWYLAQGALESNIGAWAYAGVAILLLSALLTAGYLLPITMKGFFPGDSTPPDEARSEPPLAMRIPLLLLATLSLLLGLLPAPLTEYAQSIAAAVLR